MSEMYRLNEDTVDASMAVKEFICLRTQALGGLQERNIFWIPGLKTFFDTIVEPKFATIKLDESSAPNKL